MIIQNLQIGGQAIGGGGWGCVFYPSIASSNSSTGKTFYAGTFNTVSKVMKRELFDVEFQKIQDIIAKLKKIFGNEAKCYFSVDYIDGGIPTDISETDISKMDERCNSGSIFKLIETARRTKDYSTLRVFHMTHLDNTLNYYFTKKIKQEDKFVNQDKEMDFIAIKYGMYRLFVKAIVGMNQRGIYHCDIKSANIMIPSSNIKRSPINSYPLLIDWGLANSRWVIAEESSQLSDKKGPIIFNNPFGKIFLTQPALTLVSDGMYNLSQEKIPDTDVHTKKILNWVFQNYRKLINGTGHEDWIQEKLYTFLEQNPEFLKENLTMGVSGNPMDYKKIIGLFPVDISTISELELIIIVNLTSTIMRNLDGNNSFNFHSAVHEMQQTVDPWGFLSCFLDLEGRRESQLAFKLLYLETNEPKTSEFVERKFLTTFDITNQHKLDLSCNRTHKPVISTLPESRVAAPAPPPVSELASPGSVLGSSAPSPVSELASPGSVLGSSAPSPVSELAPPGSVLGSPPPPPRTSVRAPTTALGSRVTPHRAAAPLPPSPLPSSLPPIVRPIPTQKGISVPGSELERRAAAAEKGSKVAVEQAKKERDERNAEEQEFIQTKSEHDRKRAALGCENVLMKTQPSTSSPSVLEKEVTLQQFNELWSVDNCGVAEFNLGDSDPTEDSRTYIFNGKTNQFLVAEIEYPHPLQDLKFYLNDYLGKIVTASSILLPRTLSILKQEFKKTKYNKNLAIQIAPNGKCPSPFKNTYRFFKTTPENVLWKDVLENPSGYYTKKIGAVEVTPRQGGGKISKKYRKTKRRSKLINKKTKQRRAVKKYTKKSRKKKRKQKKQSRKRVKY